MRSIIPTLLIFIVLGLDTALAIGQQHPKIPKIGWISSGAPNQAHLRDISAFRQGLEEHGYIEGRNIIIEYRNANRQRDRLPGLAAELIDLGVDVIVPTGPTAAAPAMKATKTIPIVMPNAGSDPVKLGFVNTLGRPGGNATGLSIGAKGLGSKRLELIMEVLPSIKSVVFLNPHRRPIVAVYLEEYRDAARKLDVEFNVVEVRNRDDFERAFTTIQTMAPDALIIERNTLTRHVPGEIANFAFKNRIPTMNNHRIFVKFGGLISYGVDYPANFRRAAAYVDKILKGANPATLPVEPPQLEIVINLKTAKKIGVTIPPQMLLEANEIIK